MADQDPTNKDEQALFNWLKSQPELYERLKQIRSLQSSDPDLDRAELELLELTRAIGASSFKEILQHKSDAAAARSVEELPVRKQSKKTELLLLVRADRSQ